MNTRMMMKLLLVLAVLLFMVMMGMSNEQKATFRLLGKEVGTLNAAFMYFVFFSAGVITGALLALGGPRGAPKSK